MRNRLVPKSMTLTFV